MPNPQYLVNTFRRQIPSGRQPARVTLAGITAEDRIDAVPSDQTGRMGRRKAALSVKQGNQ